MRFRLLPGLCAAMVASALPVTAHGREKHASDPAAIVLYQKAAALSNIRAPDATPFRLSATIQIPVRFHEPLRGTYLMLWASPHQWREEVMLPDYQRVRYGGDGKYSQVRSVDYEPLPTYALDRALAFISALHAMATDPELFLEKPKQKKEEICVKSRLEITQPGSGSRPPKPELADGPQTCFDAQTGALRDTDLNGAYGDSLLIERVRYSGDSQFFAKLFPKQIEVRGDVGPIVTLTMTQLTPLGPLADANFVPPPNATVWPTCDAPGHPKLLRWIFPVYPQAAKWAHVQGKVAVYGVIGTDGTLHNLRPLVGDPTLTDAAVQALQRWTYQPQTCNGKPVPAETVIATVFTLGG